MFSRWCKENFFRYMRHEFALDHLCTNDIEPVDPKRPVPHPGRTRLNKELGRAKALLGRFVVRRGGLQSD